MNKEFDMMSLKEATSLVKLIKLVQWANTSNQFILWCKVLKGKLLQKTNNGKNWNLRKETINTKKEIWIWEKERKDKSTLIQLQEIIGIQFSEY